MTFWPFSILKVGPPSTLISRLLTAFRMIGSLTLVRWASKTIFVRASVLSGPSSKASFCTSSHLHDLEGPWAPLDFATSYSSPTNRLRTEVNCDLALAGRILSSLQR